MNPKKTPFEFYTDNGGFVLIEYLYSDVKEIFLSVCLFMRTWGLMVFLLI